MSSSVRPHLLSLLAQYADLRTISILASTSHLKLKFDKDFVMGDFSTRLRQRMGVAENLANEFEDLLNLQGSVENECIESQMDRAYSGLTAPT
jgi:hypothetical protein